MTSITQKINSINGGISQQPDELKIPGQVVTAKNVFPDVTHGLQKRPGSLLVKSLSNNGTASLNSQENGKWFSYYRDENEQYIGQISRTGDVNMWRCSTFTVGGVTYPAGDPVNVVPDSSTSSAIATYLTHTADDDIQTLTLNDNTFINNRTYPTAMAATTEPAQPNQAFIELKQIKYASQYGVDLFNSTTSNTLSTVSTVTRLGIEYNASASPDPNNAVNTDGSATDYDLDTDGTCDSVGTQLFTVNASDTNSYVVLYTGSSSASNTFNNRGTDLIFRITTTGQPTTDGGSNPTYVCRYTVKIDLLHGGSGWQVGDKIRVETWNGHTQTHYNVVVEEVSTAKVAANLGLVRPTPTPFDGETAITGDMILGKIREGITGNATNTGNGFEVEQIGDGLYITRTAGTFNVNTPVSELLNVLTSEVQDVADLPKQCKDGYVVKVRNSANDEDDYYLKFFANNGLSGDGVWEECNKPTRKIAFDKSSMPVKLVRTSYTQFTLSQIAYEDCAVGDPKTAPKPSFISTVAGQDEDIVTANKTINKMVFFRNRLVFLSDENVIMSRPGDFFNFWAKSAIAASAEDPIDISCSSEYPAIIFDGIEVNSGLVLFTKNQQFMLTTDSDVLSPITAKINALSTYNFNHQTNPVSLGTTIAFLDNAGKFTRMFEMASVLREGEPVILEQSKVISKLFPKNINLIANSRENSFIVFAEKNQPTVYGFRYFTSGEKRIMQSWVTWELSGNIQYMCMLDDAIYAVVRNGTTNVMQKINLKLSGEDGESITQYSNTHGVHLDNIHTISHSSTTLTYNSSANKTTFAMPEGFYYKVAERNLLANSQTIPNPNGSELIVNPLGVTEDISYYDFATNEANNTFHIFTAATHTTGSGAVQPYASTLYARTDQGTCSISMYLNGGNVDASGNSNSTSISPPHPDDSRGREFLVDTTWRRIGGTQTNVSTSYRNNHPEFDIEFENPAGNSTTTKVYIWGAQLEQTSVTSLERTPITDNKSFAVYDVDSSNELGRFREATVNSGTIEIEGDWRNQDFLLGYLYDMEVELPKFYVTQQSGDRFVSDVQSNLVVHRVKFNFGPLGAYQTTLKRVGKPDFTETYESIFADQYSPSKLAIQTEQEVTVPVYERNTNYTLTIKSSKPTPATLYSLAWEGDYSNTFYKRV